MHHEHWRPIHTISGTILLICLISVFKNPFIFFKDYATALDLTDFQYSIILLALYLGNITSLFFGVYVNNLFQQKYQSVAALFSFISGLLSFLFVLIEYLKTIHYSNSSYSAIIITAYGSIIAFLYKNAASICYATVVGLASDWSPPNANGANIAYLQLSWSLSTLLFIPIGFMLQYLSWYIPFVSFAAILIFYSLVIFYGFSFKQEEQMLPINKGLVMPFLTHLPNLQSFMSNRIIRRTFAMGLRIIRRTWAMGGLAHNSN